MPSICVILVDLIQERPWISRCYEAMGDERSTKISWPNQNTQEDGSYWRRAGIECVVSQLDFKTDTTFREKLSQEELKFDGVVDRVTRE